MLGGWRVFDDGDVDIDAHCREWVTDDIPDRIAELQPDVVMLLTTSWDVLDRRLAEGAPPVTPLDPAYEQRIRAAFAELTDSLLAAGAQRVAWVRQPIPDPFWLADVNQQEDRARHEVLYAAMEAEATGGAGAVSVVDLAGWVTSSGLATDREARPDGVHWDVETATAIAEQWLGQQLIVVALAAGT